MDRLAKLERMLQADPADAFVLYGLALEHAKLGDHARAITFFDRCLAADASQHYAAYHKARSQLALGDRAGAAGTVRAGLAQSRAAGDAKAAGELEALLDEVGD